ncbi:hypothetical protein [Streptomyces malaysiensis]
MELVCTGARRSRRRAVPAALAVGVVLLAAGCVPGTDGWAGR